MITNLTPHPIHLFGWDVPDQFEPGAYEPHTTLPPSGTVARIGEMELGTQSLRGCDVPIEFVQHGHSSGLPPKYENFDTNTNWYVVSLALALSLALVRNDLLVPYKAIRNAQGTVIGSRTLALPV